MKDTENTPTKMIRFVNTDGVELFQIPDGGNIVITSPDFETNVRKCKYLGETHVSVDGHTYHINQFAEIMERNGNKYEPETQLKDVEILTPEPKQLTQDIKYKDIKDRCLGYVIGEFRNYDSRYFLSNSGFETAKTDKARTETAQVLYALRKWYFKDRESMREYCDRYPDARVPYEGRDTFSIHLFKISTGKYDYLVRVTDDKERGDSRFQIYCCKKQRERAKHTLPVKEYVIFDNTDITEYENPDIDVERNKLNIQFKNGIIAVMNVGHYGGAYNGYEMINSGNVKDCMDFFESNFAKWFVDARGNLKSELHYDNSVSYGLYRAFKEDVTDKQKGDFLDKIITNTLNQDDVSRYTLSLGDDIAKIYGFEIAKSVPPKMQGDNER